nr:light-regulated protein [Quercus suber]
MCEDCEPVPIWERHVEPSVKIRLLSCETVGGEACDAEMYPEVKIKPEVRYKTAKTSSEAVEREYFEYNEPKT